MQNATSERSKPRRSWRRFSLRKFLVVLTLLGIVLGLTGRSLEQSRRREDAIDALQRVGFDIETYPTPLLWGVENLLPEFVGPVSVTVSSPFSSPQFQPSLSLARDEKLVESGITPFRESNLAHLNELGDLRVLSLEYTSTTDNGLAQLRGLTSLRMLWLNRYENSTPQTPNSLYQPQISDVGLEHLTGLRHLTMLGLMGADITDDGLSSLLLKLDRLEYLYLSNTKISDASVKAIARQQDLKSLNISSTQITDTGLIQILTSCDDLYVFAFDHTKISDAAIPAITKQKHLQLLMISETQITNEGAERLHRLLPQCTIER